jgi:uncharacterized membrane protein
MRRLAIFLVLVAALAAGFAAAAQDPAPAVEQLGDVQTLAPGDVEGKPTGIGDLAGRLHPALVHFPIAWLVGLALVDFVGLVRKREAWQRAGIFVLAGTVLSLVPTAATGLLRAAHMEFDANLRALLVVHRTLNLVVAGLLLVALALRLARRNRLDGWWRRAYLVVVFAATGVVLVAADFGGRMVYGPNYLPW